MKSSKHKESPICAIFVRDDDCRQAPAARAAAAMGILRRRRRVFRNNFRFHHSVDNSGAFPRYPCEVGCRTGRRVSRYCTLDRIRQRSALLSVCMSKMPYLVICTASEEASRTSKFVAKQDDDKQTKRFNWYCKFPVKAR